MDKLKRFLNGDERDDDSSTGILPDLDTRSLSWKTRITGFIVCFILGLIISLFGVLSLFFHKGLTMYALFYTLGNIISILSTCFLMGPVNQLKKMFNQTRVVATITVFVMMGLTLFAAITKHAGLSLLFMILQWCAMVWYSLSYIPYARDAVKKTFESCIV
ncbi:vesicle transport protein SFT2B [Cimex lectularius]|uniref:Vesicle transport protein n=1 Tax=Cimex lectularius TaxID=79782 RepID=A0A8I6RA34_CIMLE|nr:vesicle transport protein SFT2B [Cimex lectularius]XP_014239291.1 vesicle transport protein SFT2B [Cimex lectularius]